MKAENNDNLTTTFHFWHQLWPSKKAGLSPVWVIGDGRMQWFYTKVHSKAGS